MNTEELKTMRRWDIIMTIVLVVCFGTSFGIFFMAATEFRCLL